MRYAPYLGDYSINYWVEADTEEQAVTAMDITLLFHNQLAWTQWVRLGRRVVPYKCPLDADRFWAVAYIRGLAAARRGDNHNPYSDDSICSIYWEKGRYLVPTPARRYRVRAMILNGETIYTDRVI